MVLKRFDRPWWLTPVIPALWEAEAGISRATKLAKIRKPTLDKPSSETFVKSAIKTVGLQSRTNGYLIHALMAWVAHACNPSTLGGRGRQITKSGVIQLDQYATTANSPLHQKPGQTWKNKEHHLSDREFVFKEPQQVVRRAPEPRVIDRAGVYEISLSPTGISRLHLYPGFVDVKEADWMLEQLCRDVPWKQRTGIREDITYQQPRLTAWYGELPYTYSRITMEANPHWHPVLRTLKNRIEENTGHTFNSLLCNLYRNEKDSVDWHSDDEPSLGRCPIIASLSFGATRTFEMRKKPPPVSILFFLCSSCLLLVCEKSRTPKSFCFQI
ncbi:Alpha-ketoglutarate-dependent dioxygenase alkB-like protein 3 [Plecturocebus cupreus]